MSVSSKPNLMILYNPGVGGGDKGFGSSVFTQHKEIAPADNIKKGVPPTIIFHGKSDTTVYYSDVEQFQKRMEAAGNECVLVGYEGQGHGFFNFSKAGGKYFVLSVTDTHKFLAKHGYLSGPPTVEEFAKNQPAPASRKKRGKK